MGDTVTRTEADQGFNWVKLVDAIGSNVERVITSRNGARISQPVYTVGQNPNEPKFGGFAATLERNQGLLIAGGLALVAFLVLTK